MNLRKKKKCYDKKHISLKRLFKLNAWSLKQTEKLYLFSQTYLTVKSRAKKCLLLTKYDCPDEFRNLLEAEKFEGTNWEAMFGSGLVNLLKEISGVNVTNKLSDRINDAVLQVDSFFGSNISKIINDEFYSETLQSNLNSISASDINFNRLDASLISFGNGRYDFSITGDNFNSNLLTLMQLAKTGSNLDEIIADGIDGQVSTFKFVDNNTNVEGVFIFFCFNKYT